MEGHRGGVLWFYPLAILIGFFPWSCFAIPLALDTASQARRRDGASASFILAICWVARLCRAVFAARGRSCPATSRRAIRGWPCWRAATSIAGAAMRRRLPAGGCRWRLACWPLWGRYLPWRFPRSPSGILPGEEWLGLLGLTPLAGGVACIGLALVRNYRAAATAFAGSAVAFSTLLFAIGAQRADHHQTSHVILRAIFDRSDNPTIASYKILEPSWVFYAGRPIRELPRAGTTIRVELQPGYIQTHELSAPTGFFLTNPEAFLITTRKELQEIGPLPEGVRVLAETGLFLKDERLVLLGREPAALAAQPAASWLPPTWTVEITEFPEPNDRRKCVCRQCLAINFPMLMNRRGACQHAARNFLAGIWLKP